MAEKKTLKIMTAYPILTIIILLVSTVSYISPVIASMLIFDRNAVLQGEIWRLFSSHFVHFSGSHLVYNLLAFGTAGWIVEKKCLLRFSFLYVLMALLISSSLFILKPSMTYYGGLSGLACGFIFYCALLWIGDPGPWGRIGKLIIFFLPIKIVLEFYFSASILPYWRQQEFVTMPASHVTGIAVALLFYVAVKNIKKYSKNRFNTVHQVCDLPSS